MVSQMMLLIMEWLGTVSFATSGSLVAIRHGLDLFGVVTVGTITAVGGGIIRDTMIGNVPPNIFSDPIILLLAVFTSLAVFVIAYIYKKRFRSFSQRFDGINIFFDALGLAAFSITGVEVAYQTLAADHIPLILVMGVITGVGGGVLRDVLVNEKPYILTKHIYAVVSAAGSGIYYLLSIYMRFKILATVFVLVFTVALRLLAAKHRWKLPKVDFLD